MSSTSLFSAAVRVTNTRLHNVHHRANYRKIHYEHRSLCVPNTFTQAELSTVDEIFKQEPRLHITLTAYTQKLASSHNQVLVASTSNNKIIGILLYYVSPRKRCDMVIQLLQINYIVVDKKFQQQGIGSNFLRMIVQLYPRHLMLIQPISRGSLSLYNRNGFVDFRPVYNMLKEARAKYSQRDFDSLPGYAAWFDDIDDQDGNDLYRIPDYISQNMISSKEKIANTLRAIGIPTYKWIHEAYSEELTELIVKHIDEKSDKGLHSTMECMFHMYRVKTQTKNTQIRKF